MEEIFKPLPWFFIEGSTLPLFYIWDFGTIRSHRFSSHYNIRTYKNKWGYEYFQFMYNKKRVSITVHKAVMLAFVWKRWENMEVNHKDWVKSNNKLENLEYCTHRENVRHSIDTWLSKFHSWKDHYLYGKTWNKHHLSYKIYQYKAHDIWGIFAKWKRINTFWSMREAARSIWWNASHISKCIKDNKLAYGFFWEKLKTDFAK